MFCGFLAEQSVPREEICSYLFSLQNIKVDSTETRVSGGFQTIRLSLPHPLPFSHPVACPPTPGASGPHT